MHADYEEETLRLDTLLKKKKKEEKDKKKEKKKLQEHISKLLTPSKDNVFKKIQQGEPLFTHNGKNVFEGTIFDPNAKHQLFHTKIFYRNIKV